MSKKTHYKITGFDYRDSGQSEECFNNQAACGFAGVTVTKFKRDVDCQLCKRMIKAADGSDDCYYDNTM